MCDVAYVLNIERLERQVLADRQVVAAFKASGDKETEMPTLAGTLEAFDAELNAEPKPETDSDRKLRRLRRL